VSLSKTTLFPKAPYCSRSTGRALPSSSLMYAGGFFLFDGIFALKFTFDSINEDTIPWIYRFGLAFALSLSNKFLNLFAKCPLASLILPPPLLPPLLRLALPFGPGNSSLFGHTPGPKRLHSQGSCSLRSTTARRPPVAACSSCCRSCLWPSRSSTSSSTGFAFQTSKLSVSGRRRRGNVRGWERGRRARRHNVALMYPCAACSTPVAQPSLRRAT